MLNTDQDDILEYFQALWSTVDGANERQEVTWIHSIETMKHNVGSDTQVKKVVLRY